MRLNVKTFHALLQILQPELELLGIDGPPDFSQDNTESSEFPEAMAKARWILPSIRQYSSWLVSQAAILAGETADKLLNVEARELGRVYVQVLNLLVNAFSVLDLPTIEYMLEEDERTIGFMPLDGPEYDRMKCRYYEDDMITRKPRLHDKDIRRREPGIEMQGRIRDIIVDGLYLAKQEVCRETFHVSVVINGLIRTFQ